MSSAQDRRNAHRRSSRQKSQPRTPPGTPQRAADKRAAWTKLRDSYLDRARATAASGDRIGAENFSQHAEHYQRMLGALGEPA